MTDRGEEGKFPGEDQYEKKLALIDEISFEERNLDKIRHELRKKVTKEQNLEQKIIEIELMLQL